MALALFLCFLKREALFFALFFEYQGMESAVREMRNRTATSRDSAAAQAQAQAHMRLAAIKDFPGVCLCV